MKIDTGELPERIEEPKQVETFPDIPRLNPRWVFVNPDAFFGHDLYDDLLMEQQEQM